MTNQPFYHLRPNKYIDRNLFVQTLVGLKGLFPISDYHYTGFGSYMFEDFKMLHDTLGISHMTSLERDYNDYNRAEYNRPYSCIDIKHISSTDYLSELVLPDDEHNIFWLDFTSPRDLGPQLADYASLLNLANAKDIIRITLNANPNSLGECSNPDELQSQRLAKLRERVPEVYLPHSISIEDVTMSKF